MGLRHCNVCSKWHDMGEAWPQACLAHYDRNKTVKAGDKRSAIFDGKIVERGRWITPHGSTESIPAHLYRAPPKSGLQIIHDIQPYKNMIDGRVVGGRKQHRDFLRAHRVEEVGNEQVKPRERTEAPGLKDAIKRAYDDCVAGRGAKPMTRAQWDAM